MKSVKAIGCIGVLALTAAAQGSQLALNPDRDAPSVDTPFGALSGEDAYRMCRANEVFVGTVTHVHGYWHEWGPPGASAREIHSDLTMTVERSIHGDVPDQVTVTTPGGTVGDHSSYIAGSYPRARVGKRYLLGLSEPAYPNDNWPDNAKIMWLVRPVDPSLTLPSSAALQALRAEICA